MYKRRRGVDEDWETWHENNTDWLISQRDGDGVLLGDPDTGAVVVEATDSIQHDAEILNNSDLPINDRRNYTPEKQRRLFGVGPHEH